MNWICFGALPPTKQRFKTTKITAEYKLENRRWLSACKLHLHWHNCALNCNFFCTWTNHAITHSYAGQVIYILYIYSIIHLSKHLHFNYQITLCFRNCKWTTVTVSWLKSMNPFQWPSYNFILQYKPSGHDILSQIEK